MAVTTKRKSKIKIKPFRFGIDQQPNAHTPKIGVNLESVGTLTTQLAGLVLSLVKFELIRRDAYKRWYMYLNQAGLRLRDLIAYLNVLHDDDHLIAALKHYYVATKLPDTDKIDLLRQATLLKEQLLEKIQYVKVLNAFPIHKVRQTEQIVE